MKKIIVLIFIMGFLVIGRGIVALNFTSGEFYDIDVETSYSRDTTHCADNDYAWDEDWSSGTNCNAYNMIYDYSNYENVTGFSDVSVNNWSMKYGVDTYAGAMYVYCHDYDADSWYELFSDGSDTWGSPIIKNTTIPKKCLEQKPLQIRVRLDASTDTGGYDYQTFYEGKLITEQPFLNPQEGKNYNDYSPDLNFTTDANGYCSYWQDSDLRNGLVGHWAFEKTLNNTHATDFSSQSNTGTWNGYTNNDGVLYNTPTWTTANNYSIRGNYILDLDRASKEFINITDDNSLDITNAITISAWIKTDLANWQHVLTKVDTGSNNGYWVRIKSDGTVEGKLYNTGTNIISATSSNSIDDDNWHYVTFTYDNSTGNAYMYIDGTEKGTDSDASNRPIGTNNINLYISGEVLKDQHYINGTIDEVRIWNRALNQSEIQNEMNSHIPIHGNGLVSSWSFEKGSGSTAFDTNNYVKGDYRAGGRFDGSDDYVSISDDSSLDISEDITISGWIKPNEAWGNQEASARILSKYEQDGWGVNQYSSTGKLRFEVKIDGTKRDIYSNTVMPDSGWLFFAITYENDTGTLIYYNDTIVKNETSYTGALQTNNYDIHMGKYVGSNSLYFNGTIDEVQIHNRALDSTEIERLYNSTKDNFIVENDTVNTNVLNYTENGTKTVYAQCHGEDVANADVTFDINPIEIRFRDNFTSGTVQNFTVTFDSNDYSSKAYSTTNGVVKLNMRDVEADNVNMELKATNYDTRTITRDIHEAFNTTYNMTPAGIYIYGFDEWDNSNITSFEITAYTGSESSNFTSNSSSYFVNASLMPTGSITVKIESSTYEAREYFMTNTLYDYSELNAYLLPSSRSDDVLFSVRSDTGTYLEGVDIDVKKYISGAWSVVGEGETDSSGSIEFNLNTETEYQLTFIKSGYGTQIVTITPVLSHYEVRLNTTVDLDYEDVWEGIEYYIEPKEKALMKNDTANFKFNITDHYSDLEWFSMNVTNSTNYVLFDNVTTSSSGGTINYSTTLTNYVNQTLTLTGKFKRSGFGTVTITKDYYVYDYEKKGWTLKDLFDALSNETHGVTKEQGGLIMMVFVAAAMSGAALVVGTVGAGVIGLIILSFVAFIGVIDWVVFSFLALLIAAIMYLKGRL